MLELAVKKLGNFNPLEDDLTIRAKKMLQKCAYAMISQQELSAQQVASYLMDFDDHFTSHLYRNFYWGSFESLINKEMPSPECYPSKHSSTSPASSDEAETPPLRNDSNDPNESHDDDEDSDDEADDYMLLNDLAEPRDANDGIDDQEVRVEIDRTGNLVATGSQVSDYQLRGEELNKISVWEFISRVDKVRKSANRRPHKAQDTPGLDMSMFFEDDAADADEPPTDRSCDSPLADEGRKRPRVTLRNGHEQSKTHILRIRGPNDNFIPVPIGQGIPRRDKNDVRERYCRFNNAAKVRRAIVGGRRQGRQVADDFSGEDITEDMILTHLEEISTRFSLKKAAANETILECTFGKRHTKIGEIFTSELLQGQVNSRKIQIHYATLPTPEQQA
ncbi:hypothetical protein B0H14DRAFT_2647051 [Mycena olivaceomarginata]|nr:hypothetical protein B0H14DRAFT_2647051 [Mycena olivaceomarginata]